MSTANRERVIAFSPSRTCCDEDWERAYLRFESPVEERRKFHRRFRRLGVEEWPRDARVLELFCGRGNGLRALDELGFTALEGADLSRPLLEEYDGPGTLYLCDCRELPFEDASRDRILIQGGVHHLPDIPADLERTLAEAARVLAPDGLLLLVEPWQTPFLSLAHAVSHIPLARRLWPKMEAFAALNYYERETYYPWLARPETILAVLDRHFAPIRRHIGWGKLMFVGRPRRAGEDR